jgi:hypothetical protein
VQPAGRTTKRIVQLPNEDPMEVQRTERGWIGHFILGDRCLFRRNTLLETEHAAVVVSTVGCLLSGDQKSIEDLGPGRKYETRAFIPKENDPYLDADVQKEVHFESPWSLPEPDDLKAQAQHETVVEEITKRLATGLWSEDLIEAVEEEEA